MVNLPPEKLGSFYLGAKYNLAKSELSEEAVNYDARDLTTHAVCVGMTGSGKTGLCIGLLEEAALDKVPALIIDPKGDMTNLLLQFEDLKSEDFEPWINPDDASRKNMTVKEYADKISDTWANGIASWGQSKDRIRDLKSSVNYTIYTPGSNAGIPINILGSFAAPKVDFDEDQEMFRERIQGIVAALLGMIDLKEDPVRSREGLLLCNLFEHYWRKGVDLDLSKLIMGIQNPPMSQLGVFDVETFYPSKDRFELAMSFNSLLASPQFQNWLMGTPLDIDKLYFTADGKPKHSIFYIAHLSDSERMFFVTLLLNSLISWMRRQSGTTSLRSLLYFDEIFGYFPPVANPPSKKPILTLLKQARAFGLGTVLVTQNPVDIDYKGLSNAGTWFIGKLQTERDKDRVLEGLKGALDTSGSSKINYGDLIGKLDSRVFLMHNVHEDAPVVFHTRWVMSYLRGPMTRPQVESIMAGKTDSALTESDSSAGHVSPKGSSENAFAGQAPNLDPSITQNYLLPQNYIDSNEINYEAKILTVSRVRYFDAKRKMDQIEEKAFILDAPDDFGRLNWDNALTVQNWKESISDHALENENIQCKYAAIPASLNTVKEFKNIESEISDYLYHHSEKELLEHEDLEIFQEPQESKEAFMMRVSIAAREERDEEMEELEEAYVRKLEKIEDKIRREERDLYDAEEESKSRKQDEFINIAETIFSVLGKGRRRRSFSGVSSKRRMSRRAADRVETIREEIEDLELDYKDLKEELENKLDDIRRNWVEQESNINVKEVKPRRADVMVDSVSLVWCPDV